MRFRQLILWGLTAALAWFIIQNIDQLELVWRALGKGQWQWMVAALGLQFVFFFFYALLYRSAFGVVGVSASIGDLYALTYAGVFANSTTPSGGTAGSALFVDDLRRHGQPISHVATGALLVLVADYSAFCVILASGLYALFSFHNLERYQIIAALIMYALVATMLGALVIGMLRPLWLYRFFDVLERLVNRIGGWFRHPPLLTDDWGDRNASEFIEAAQTMAGQRYRVVRTLLIALITHTINVLILYCCFWTFDQPVTFGVLIAGYSMTILFWIVSPTPNGIGIVESLMPVIYTSLGLPAAEATVISFAFRAFTFWLPLLIGFVLLRRLPMFEHTEPSIGDTGDVRVVAVLTTIMGLVNVVSGSTPALADRLAWVVYLTPLTISHGGHLTSVLLGFTLILLAQRLWQRKRAAWFWTMTTLLLSVVIHLIKGLDYEEAILAGVFSGYLFSQHRHFYAVSDPPSLLNGLRLLLTAVIFTLGYGTVGFYLLDRQFAQSYTLDAALNQTLILFSEPWNTGLQPITDFGQFFGFSIYLIAAATIGYALFATVQSFLSSAPDSVTRMRHARTIVERHGRSSVARLILLPDKRYYFSEGGSVIAYTVFQRTAVALGDPIGPVADAGEAILGFQALGKKRGWQVSFVLAAPETLDAYKATGFEAFKVGYEGIVDLGTQLRAGMINSQVQATVERLRKAGWRARLHRPLQNDHFLSELRSVNEAWLAATHNQERRFLVGWFDDEYIRHSPIFAIHTPNDGLVAFANLLPGYQNNEVACDLVRWRSPGNQADCNQEEVFEFLFATLIEWAQERGYVTFNLGLSTLRGMGDQLEDPIEASGVRFVAEWVNQLYNFRGDYAFKQKFQPEWSPRYLIYPNTGSLPDIALTLNRAITRDDFVVDTVRDLVLQVRQRRNNDAAVS